MNDVRAELITTPSADGKVAQVARFVAGTAQILLSKIDAGMADPQHRLQLAGGTVVAVNAYDAHPTLGTA